MFGLLKLLWPFIVEVFLQNSEVRDTVKRPSFIVKSLLLLTFVGTLVVFLFDTAGSLFFDAHTRLRSVSKEYYELEDQYRELLQDRNRLHHQINTLTLQLDHLDTVVNTIGQQQGAGARCVPVPPSSRVRELLSGL